jgi:putative heme-binding domain-containing protein
VAFQSHENLQRLIADELDDEAEQSSQQRAALLDILAETTLRVPPPRWCEAVKSALTSAEKSVRAGGVHVAAAWQLAQFDPLLARIAHSESTPVSLRLSALHAVASRRHELPEPTFTMLLAQLSEDIGPLTRLTAAEILGKSALDDLQLRRLLHAVQGDALISPDVILPAVKQSASENTSRDVADYLEASIRSGWKPPEEHLRKSLNGLPSLDQSDIDRLSDLLQQRVSLHQSALKDLTTLLEGGDARLGRAVFHSQKAACASCHRVGSDGGDVGPDLTRVGSVRASVDILEAIAFPSASIVQGYQSYTVVTADGRLVTGILKEKSQTTIRLREQSGAWHTILIDDVETMERLPTSMMPEGLSNVLTRAQLRDLLSYLQSLK